MKLSYFTDPLSGSTKRRTVTARVTTEHSTSSYGQPVIVMPDGEALDLASWALCGYRVEKATSEERSLLAEVFKPLGMIF